MTRMKVPAYVEIGTEWVHVGWANVDLSMHSADITINEDAPAAQALAALMASKTGPAIAFPTVDKSDEVSISNAVKALRSYEGDPHFDDDSPAVISAAESVDRQDRQHEGHKPIDHKDGKAPWCNDCSFDKNYKEPANILVVEDPKKLSQVHITRPVAPNIHLLRPQRDAWPV